MPTSRHSAPYTTTTGEAVFRAVYGTAATNQTSVTITSVGWRSPPAPKRVLPKPPPPRTRPIRAAVPIDARRPVRTRRESRPEVLAACLQARRL